MNNLRVTIKFEESGMNSIAPTCQCCDIKSFESRAEFTNDDAKFAIHHSLVQFLAFILSRFSGSVTASELLSRLIVDIGEDQGDGECVAVVDAELYETAVNILSQ